MAMIPTRFVIAVMLFTSCAISYMVRVNMSINILAMVEPPKNDNGTNVKPECQKSTTLNHTVDGAVFAEFTALPDYGKRYEWDTKVQGLILGAYFWGYTIMSIPGGIFAERYGPTRSVMISTLIAGAVTLLGPLMASWHYAALIVSRFIAGLTGGVIYPCLHCLVSRWAPPEEKGKFIGALLGGNLGTVVTWPILSAIIEQWGWTWSFFINGAVVLVWCIFWILLVRDSPEAHPRISDEEKDYIVNSLGNVVRKAKTLPPYKHIVMSVPFWALCLLHYGNLWGLFFLMTAGPNFLSTVLGFNLGHTGILASLPHLARLGFGIVFGFIGDGIKSRQLLSTTVVRKSFVLFSHIIPGVLLLILNVTGCDVSWSIALITLSLGSNGASTLTNLQNSQDLAPNFAGTLYGMINFIGSTTGFVTPLIVGYMTAEHNGLHEWHLIFSLGAIVYMACGVIFIIFGSGTLQKWNEIAAEKSNKVDKGLDNPAFDNGSDVTLKIDYAENTKV